VDLDVLPGEVHAVLGENGAGKSTLMQVISGALAPDAGELWLDGVRYAPNGPLAARQAGVAIVYQEPRLCPHLSVRENVLLGVEPTRFGVLDKASARARVARALSLVSTEASALDPERRVSRLTPSERQRVTMARALAQTSCRLMILDEPTSSLGQADVELLFDVIRQLKSSGIAILYISHFLEEVQRIADRFSVLRDGETVGSGSLASVTRDELIQCMLGPRPGNALGSASASELRSRSPRTPGEVLLEVELPKTPVRAGAADLSLRAGEVLGIAGLLGSGRSELLRAIFGLDPLAGRRVRVKQHTGPASPTARVAQGVGLLSEDRKDEGLAQQLSLADNLTLSHSGGLGPAGLVLPSRMARVTRACIQRLGIRCRGPWQRAGELSGGNQQKLALARLLHQDADVLLLDEPTRGIDVQSRAQIYAIIDDLARRGKAILMVSSYLPELLGVCDRIQVMRAGALGPSHAAERVTEHDLLTEAIG
jgi:ribose transport system ATP-binding protein